MRFDLIHPSSSVPLRPPELRPRPRPPRSVIENLIAKGNVELVEVVKNFKQRHHILGTYVVQYEDAARKAALPKPAHSAFLESFYKGPSVPA